MNGSFFSYSPRCCFRPFSSCKHSHHLISIHVQPITKRNTSSKMKFTPLALLANFLALGAALPTSMMTDTNHHVLPGMVSHPHPLSSNARLTSPSGKALKLSP